jgi:hypothetical protein
MSSNVNPVAGWKTYVTATAGLGLLILTLWLTIRAIKLLNALPSSGWPDYLVLGFMVVPLLLGAGLIQLAFSRTRGDVPRRRHSAAVGALLWGGSFAILGALGQTTIRHALFVLTCGAIGTGLAAGLLKSIERTHTNREVN